MTHYDSDKLVRKIALVNSNLSIKNIYMNEGSRFEEVPNTWFDLSHGPTSVFKIENSKMDFKGKFV
jgi:hypothetical protein